RQLESEHSGRLRVRWSEASKQFLIEQKVARATPRRVLPNDDEAIRQRDGYAFVLSVTPGDRTACPRCARTVKVPVLEMKTAKCGACGHEFRACYFPLGHALLQHLRYTDP